MEPDKKLMQISLLLTFVAGYCDTTTFVSANEMFSAHVTGNFIVLAYDLIKHADAQAWIKLLTFPVFVVAVITGGWIAHRSAKTYTVLLAEGALLTIAGLLSFLAGIYRSETAWMIYSLAMLIVFAMGLQNAFGKVFSKETYGPTTMMTGNVTQAALDLGRLIIDRPANSAIWSSFGHQALIIGGFLLGCILGGLISQQVGLSAVLLPGALLIVSMFNLNKHFSV